MNIKKSILFALTCFSTAPLFAQQKDTAAMFKEFVNICTAYRQMPLQLNMEYKKTSNLPIEEEDTAAFTARFYIQKEGAYISFGDMEQLINDSVGLMIMHSIKQMIISQNNEPVLSMLKAVTGPALPDSAVQKFREEFIVEKQMNNQQGIIQVKAKRTIPGTVLPFQEIILKYNVKTGMPEEIKTISRSLVPVGADAEVNKQFQIVIIDEKGRFVLKEDNASYTYKSITHNTDQKLPQVIADRVTTDKDNNFVPVKAYESYLLTQH